MKGQPKTKTKRAAAPPRYSDWQLDQMRDCLQAFRHYGRKYDGHYFTWKDVMEAITEYTGTRIPHERLRQFVEGVNMDDGGRKYPVPKDASIKAVYDFVTHDELDLISEEELKVHNAGFQAPLRLLDYLDQDFDGERQVPIERLHGRYRCCKVDGDEFIIREITLQRPMETGMVQVVEAESSYAKEYANTRYEHWTLPQRREHRTGYNLYGGWAVVTPEDNLIFFMKNERNNLNRYYFTLATDLASWLDTPLSWLVLLDHDFPIVRTAPDNNSKQMDKDARHAIIEKMLSYQRLGQGDDHA